jgi:hypothetical protein
VRLDGCLVGFSQLLHPHRRQVKHLSHTNKWISLTIKTGIAFKPRWFNITFNSRILQDGYIQVVTVWILGWRLERTRFLDLSHNLFILSHSTLRGYGLDSVNIAARFVDVFSEQAATWAEQHRHQLQQQR